MCRIFLGILKNGESKNLKVKQICLYNLFPKLVNISLPMVKAEHSELFMRILVRGCKVEWGNDAAKMKHFSPHLNLATDFLKSGGLVLDTDFTGEKVKNFKRVLLSLKRCYLDVSEKNKRTILEVMLLYVT